MIKENPLNIIPLKGDKIDSAMSVVSQLDDALIAFSNNELRSKINYRETFGQNIKNGRTNFGYFPNGNVAGLISIISHLKIKSLFDMGIGCGFILRALRNYFGKDISLGGIDINPKLVQIARTILYRYSEDREKIIEGDILQLQKEQISNYEAIYFWDPFRDEKIIKTFIKHLSLICKKDQYIIAQSCGINHIIHYKIANKEITNIEDLGSFHGYSIFQYK
jgi:hypothetical protein